MALNFERLKWLVAVGGLCVLMICFFNIALSSTPSNSSRPLPVTEDKLSSETTTFSPSTISTTSPTSPSTTSPPTSTKHLGQDTTPNSSTTLPLSTATTPLTVPTKRWKVHFIVTTPDGVLDPLYLCALHAAARFANETGSEIILHSPVAHYPNLSISSDVLTVRKINYQEAYAGTPLSFWYMNPDRSSDPYYVMNLGNSMRLAVLYKEGGTYLDLDMITLQPGLLLVRDAEGAVARQERTQLNGAFLSFHEDSPWLMEAMRNFVQNYKPVWGQNGPQLVSRVCFGQTKSGNYLRGEREITATRCTHRTAARKQPLIYKMEYIYGVLWQKEEHDRLFSSAAKDWRWWEARKSAGLHFYHHTIQERGNKCFPRGSIGRSIFESACPTVDMSSLMCKD